MIKIAICDDEKFYLDSAESKIRGHKICTLTEVDIQTYQSSEFLLYDIKEGKYFDILLLDVEMPKVNGMELAFEAKKALPNLLIIFFTSFIDYAINGYELSIFRFIHKNDLSNINKVFDDIVIFMDSQKEKYYTILSKNKFERLEYKHIAYIYKENKNSVFVTIFGTEKKERKSLKLVSEELNNDFIYIDRGFIVNIMHVKSILPDSVVLSTEEKLPLSRANGKAVKEALSKYWGRFV